MAVGIRKKRFNTIDYQASCSIPVFWDWHENCTVVACSMMCTRLMGKIAFAGITFLTLALASAADSSETNNIRPFDVYWQHSSGLLGLWKVGTNSNLESAVALPELGITGTGWNLVTGGDFDKNGHDDLLWLHSSGAVAVWFMEGTNRISGEVLQTRASGAWNIVGVSDFDQDTNLDLLWQHPSGRLGVWYLTNQIVVREAKGLTLPLPGPTWDVVGVLDLDGDSDKDFLWQHKQGSLAWWKMDGTNLVEGALLPFAPVGPTWRIVAVKDMNSDGSADYVWQSNKGDIAIWEMNGFERLSSSILPLPKVATGWKPKAFRF